jgi:hypothetical protein
MTQTSKIHELFKCRDIPTSSIDNAVETAFREDVIKALEYVLSVTNLPNTEDNRTLVYAGYIVGVALGTQMDISEYES